MDKHPIPFGAKLHATRQSLAALMGVVAIGAIATVASGTPSMAQIAGTKFGVADLSRLENVGYVARRGVVVGRGYRGAYVGRRAYGYRGRYGYGVGAGVAGAAAAAIIGGALAAPYYQQQPYGYYQEPYGYYQQPYGYGSGYDGY
jgi:hypothetical protein